MPYSEEAKSITESLFHSDLESEKNNIISHDFKDFTSNPELQKPDTLNSKSDVEIQLATRFEYKTNSYIILYITDLRNLDQNVHSIKFNKCFLRISVHPDIQRNVKMTESQEMEIYSIIEINKKFKLYTDITEIEDRNILIQLYLKNRFKKFLFVGQTFVEICQQQTFNELKWHTFGDKPQTIFHFVSSLVYRGDLHIALKYAASATINVTSINNLEPTNQVMLWVKKAENLYSGQIDKLCNSFVKVQLLPLDKKLHPVQKTKCIKNSCNPAWNVILKFENINLQSLHQMGLEILIFNRISLFRKVFVGGVRLNLGPTNSRRAIINWMDASSTETVIWRKMLTKPNTWICGEIRLRPDMY